MKVSLLTGGMDGHYALGLISGLIGKPISVDVIGNDEMENADVMKKEEVIYHNLRGDQTPDASVLAKAARVLKYYGRLLKYAGRTDSNIFHILWLNKFAFFDRTLLNMYYKALGKKILFTAHNVNAGERDGNDNFFNRVSLNIFYKTVDHIFVHTDRMKQQLIGDYGIGEGKVTVIPFGINNVIARTGLTRVDARRKLDLRGNEKTILFFGNIAPYKGLDTLIAAMVHLRKRRDDFKLIIAGKVKDRKWEWYWERIERMIEEHGMNEDIRRKIEYIPDNEVEFYYKAADVLVLPYRHIFQSGVLFLAYSFGLPVIAANVGSLSEEIVEGETGFVFQRENPEDLADKICKYFDSDLYKMAEENRGRIIEYANDRYSWERIGDIIRGIYGRFDRTLPDTCYRGKLKNKAHARQ